VTKDISNLDYIEKKVLDFIKSESLISQGDSIILSVSGGSDSIALSEILYNLSSILNLNLYIVYIDHHVRSNTYIEKEIIKDYATSRSIPYSFLDIYTTDFTEKTLREERYKALIKFSEKIKFNKIALGHTLDDQIETIIMSFFKGYGIEGLCGIPTKRDNFIRPIIILSKEEILEYCKRKNLKYVDDFTNLLPISLRNRIRYQLIPFLKENIPQFPQSIISQSVILSIENDLLEKLSKKYFDGLKRSNNVIEIENEGWKLLHDAIKIRVLTEIFKNFNEELSNEAIFYILREMSIIEGSKTLEIGNTEIYLYNQKIYIYKKEKHEFIIILPIPGEVKLPTGEILKAELIRNEGEPFNFKDLWHAYFDYDKIKAKELIVRNWKEGDRIEPFGLEGKSKKVQDVFVDKKIPKWKRKIIPLVTYKDKILWIPGVIRSDIAKVTNDTQTILHLSLKKEV